MRTVVKDYPCYLKMGDVDIEVGGKGEKMPRPKLIVIEGRVAYRLKSDTVVPVEALLDTGNEVTVIKSEKIRELETSLGFRLPVKRKIQYYGFEHLQPTFDLAFVFPEGHPYHSKYGFIVPTYWDFDVADIWLGQDILGQLVITLDGVNETVTIVDPKA
jgi:hypothetical protein